MNCHVLFFLFLFNAVKVERIHPYPVTFVPSLTDTVKKEYAEKYGLYFPTESLLTSTGVYFTGGTVSPENGEAAFIRSAPHYSVPVYIDSIPVPSVLGKGQFNLSLLPPEIFDEIQVFKGPATDIFGSRASLGAFNVLLLPQRTSFAKLYILEGGNWFLSSGARLSTEYGVFSGSAGGDFSPYHREGRNSSRAYVKTVNSGRVRGFRWKTMILYSTRKGDIGYKYSYSLSLLKKIPVGVIDPNDTYLANLFLAEAVGSANAGGLNVALKTYTARTGERFSYIPDNLDSSAFTGGDHLNVRDAFWVYGVRANAGEGTGNFKWFVDFGVEGERVKYSCASFLPGFCRTGDSSQSQERSRRRLWLSFRQFFKVGFLNFATSVRAEDYNTHGTTYGVSARTFFILPHISDVLHLSLSGGISQGMRIPSMGELYFNLVSNPDLRPEHTLLTDTSLVIRFRAESVKGRIRFTYFKNWLRDMISAVIEVTPDGPVMSLANLAKAYIEGIETATEINVGRTFEASFNYTHSRGRTQDRALREVMVKRVPENVMNLFLLFKRSALALAFDLRFFGPWLEDEYYDENGQYHSAGKTGPYLTLNGNATLKVKRKDRRGVQTKLFVRIYNILDSEFRLPGGYPGYPRRLMLGLEADF